MNRSLDLGSEMNYSCDMRTATVLVLSLGATLLLSACGTTGSMRLSTPVSDEPVPASEPRATLSAHVDLPQQPRCEETFDLALYKDPGVDLITWDAHPATCRDRSLRVRYLPRRLHAHDLKQKISSMVDHVSFTSQANSDVQE